MMKTTVPAPRMIQNRFSCDWATGPRASNVDCGLLGVQPSTSVSRAPSIAKPTRILPRFNTLDIFR